MSKFSALFTVLALSLIANALTTTLTSTNLHTITAIRYNQNVQESDSLTTVGNSTTETVGIPYNSANVHVVSSTSTVFVTAGSNYTFSQALQSASSPAKKTSVSTQSPTALRHKTTTVSVSSAESSTQSPTVFTTTKKHTVFKVSNSVTTTLSTNSVGSTTDVVETSQSRYAVSTSSKVTTVTTKLTSLATTAAVSISKTAVTKTKTIYTASTTPSTTFTGSAPSSSYTSGQNPLFSNSQSTVEQSTTITTSDLTEAVTITASTTSSTSATAAASGTNTASNEATTSGAGSTIISSAGGYFNSSSSSIGSTSEIVSSLNTTSLLSSDISSSLTASLNVSSAISTGSSIISSSFALNSSTVSSNPSVASSTQLSSSIASSSQLSSSIAADSTTSSDSVSVSSSQSTVISSSAASSASTEFNLFSPVATDAPPSIFPREALPLEILDGVSNDGNPFETNKFYANLFLDTQEDMVWTYPYGMFKLSSTYYGFAVSHTTTSQYVFGNYNDEGTAEYYYNPVDIASIIFSADGFSSDNFDMDVSDMKAMSVLVTIFNNASSPDSNFIDLSLVQGMGFVSATYNGNLTPLLNSNVGFSKLVSESSDALNSNVLKYKATLYNDVEWLIYVTVPSGTSGFSLSADGDYAIKGSKAVDGLIIQVAVAPDSGDSYYDEAAGTYVTTAEVQGTSNGDSASYQFKYTTEGDSSSGYPIIFALPHHLKSFTSATTGRSTGISLDSTTKGTMYAYLTDELSFEDSFNTQVQWLPWSQQMTGDLSYNATQLQLLASVANSELSVDFTSSTSGLSTYYAGKYLDKYAYILLVIDQIIDDDSVRNSTLERLKDAFDTFLNNEQLYPLMYDTRYGGVTSTAAQDGDTSADFGGPYYNDHHFHYGYFVHAAAVVGMIDAKLGGTWAEENKDWVNSLVRDVANPSDSDSYFPVSRMFDWFAGHSWAAGLFANADGKNEESSSEDYNFAYGMKLWGKVIGDSAMEARGNLMISIMAKSMNDYFLYSDDNDIEPSEIIGNKVSGILFDNKIDHTTWFGSNTEYIHGIHMLPITPVSSVVRGPTFVSQEWSEVIASIISDVDSGWTGILRLNQALTDPQASYDFFAQDDFSSTWLDNGMSRTWSLAFSGGLSNAV